MAAWTTGDFARSGTLAHEAVTLLLGVGGEPLALAYAQRARTALRAQDFALAADDASTALHLAPAPGRARVLALNAAGNAAHALGDPGAQDLLEEAATSAGELGLTWEEQRANGNLIETALDTRDVDRAERLNDQYRADVDDDLGVASWHALMDARIAAARGEYEGAETRLRALVDRDDLIESLRYWCDALITEVHVRRGDARARNGVERFARWADGAGEFQDRVWSATVSAQHLWSFRRADAAATARNVAVLARLAPGGGRWAIGELALWLWLDGNLEAAPERAAEPVRWLADGEWRRTADWFADRGLPYEQAVALGCGDVAARLEALRIAQRTGARALAARYRRDLVDDGRSNADIAARLFLSPRTVENHVSAVLTALGVSSRAEAVARESGSVD